MDKKNMIIGVLLLIAAFVSLRFTTPVAPPPPTAPEIAQSGASPLTPNQPPPIPTPTSPRDAAFTASVEESSDARITTLANDFIEVRFTDFGGAISDVALKKYAASKETPNEPYVFNRRHADPALAFVDSPGLDRRTRYELVSSSATEVVYRAVLGNTIEVTRRYAIVPASNPSGDPYQLRHETAFRNLTDQPQQAPRTLLSLGTAAPLYNDDPGIFLATAHNAGGEVEFTERADLQGGGFLGMIGLRSGADIPFIETGGPLLWAAVNNQFFTSILTPDETVAGMITQRVQLPPFPGGLEAVYGVTGTARFDVPPLAPNSETQLGSQFYVGPKEYSRLANGNVFQRDQDKVMQFGMFKFFSQILITLMSWVNGFVNNWGIAIIITTLILKIVFLPLTLAASKSAKRMQKIQPEMQAVREKYKDNPQKLQMETMALFKKHRVNPMGGCLPILITIPFFIGFFQMLQSTAELRFAEFLWAEDLSAPDTVATVFGIPIRIMPLLMGATMIIQMRLVPQPTVDNAQAKIFKFMPWVFTFFCYHFSCALALYSTVNGLFTIGQQLVINRMKDEYVTSPGGAATTTASTVGKAVKNVTPKKKK